MSSSSSRTQGMAERPSGSREAAEPGQSSGVLAGVGASSSAGDLATPSSAWMRSGLMT